MKYENIKDRYIELKMHGERPLEITVSETMERKYSDYINKNFPTYETSRGKCVEATLDMQKAFPELLRVRGYFLDPYEDDRPHWWLKTVDGEIIDPTVKQFTYYSDEQYEERDETQPEPLGKCVNCGEYAYDDPNFCSYECSTSYMEYLKS